MKKPAKHLNMNSGSSLTIGEKGKMPNHNSPLDSLLAESKLVKYRWNIWFMVSFVLILIVWSYFAELDEVAKAVGEVVPQEQLKVVQHLEGGVVEKILVQEGDLVKNGDVLVQISLGAGAVNKNEIIAAIDGLSLTQSRLEAEINLLNTPNFDPEISARQPNILESEMNIFNSRKKELAGKIAIVNLRIKQKKLEVEELSSHQRASKNDLGLTKERLAMSNTLVEQGLVSKMEHVSLKAEVGRMEGEIDVMLASLPRAQAAYNETIAQLNAENQAYNSRAIEELGEVRRRQSQLNETLVTASDQDRRTDVRAPIDGIVKTLRFNTIGGVVKPGEAILDIVPESDSLVIRAKLDPQDRGYVVAGLPANVKISTFDYARYGDLEGVVERIAASTDLTPEGIAYYTVIVKTNKNYLGEQKGQFDIQPGMQAVVDIHTGTRTVLDYIIRPVLKLRHEAFHER